MCSDVTGECIPSMCVKLLITCMSEEMGETVWRVDDHFLTYSMVVEGICSKQKILGKEARQLY